MSYVRSADFSRRGLLAAGGALGLGALLTACGDDSSSTKTTDAGADASASASASAKAGPFSFKDDRGTTVELDKTPANIVAFVGVAAALFDYGVECKAVFGPTKTTGDKADVQAGDLDITKVTILGNSWDQFNVEQYAALKPDVLISTMFDDAGTLWYVPETSKDKIYKLAPSIGISVFDMPITEPLARMLELAGALGADITASKVTDAKKAFETAAERLRAAAKARPEIKVLAGSGADQLFYVSGSNLSIDLEYFKQLGVNIVEPDADALKENGGWYEGLSWENADKYPADIIMMDDRSSALQPTALDKSKPTWAQLPAVKAGQVIPRSTEPILSYAKCTPMLDDLAKAIEDAKKVA